MWVKGAGRLSECVSAIKLASAWKCQDTFKFEVWKYGEGRAPVIAPSSVPPHRYLTPGNELIGTVGVVVRRGKAQPCSTGDNSYVKKWVSGSGVCMGDRWELEPYGFDSVFLASSHIYDGNLRVQEFYDPSERRNTSSPPSSTAAASGSLEAVPRGAGIPFLFFPHGYDSTTRAKKGASLVVDEFKDSYLLFLDYRLSSASGKKLVYLLQEGGLLDEQVKEVDIHVPIFNPQLMLLGLGTIQVR